ncbi:protein TRACHEARY ELEMENT DIFFERENTIATION-RELATED 7A-like [Impatiens glandulifera]|uniref:protein TRACHEARY ELEMENT DIFFERENTIATION-RELATED 7A-like n=1 Tax=Impatiens glandulifera TaxID=253017 RepID=UPI001FB0D704|nr:protein TRACHEARY ELEMENT DIFFERENTIATION-RELATED 7A-like [Impatiens glandulifera]
METQLLIFSSPVLNFGIFISFFLSFPSIAFSQKDFPGKNPPPPPPPSSPPPFSLFPPPPPPHQPLLSPPNTGVTAQSPAPHPSTNPRPRPPPPPWSPRRLPPPAAAPPIDHELAPLESPATAMKEEINQGKKIGLIFLGVAGILQIVVISFLIIKRKQLLKN